MRELKEGGIYSYALSPYQYVARRLPAASIAAHELGLRWLLIPEQLGPSLVTGPVLFADKDGRIGVSDGYTPATTDDLDFTGRYKQDGQQTDV